MTKLKVVDDREKPNADGLIENSKGGTEMMARGLKARLDRELYDKFNIVKSRVSDNSFSDDKINLFWAHDLVQDPAHRLGEKEIRDRFAKFIFVSEWQKQQYQDYLGIAPSKSVVLKNAIEPITTKFSDKELKKGEPLRLIYHTTPHRGLSILVPLIEELAKTKNIHLDVYSSFSIYGWDHGDTAYEPLYDRIRKHPNMTYHGYKENSVVRKALKRAHLFAFPSIWVETSCISIIEASSAAVHCLYPNLGALPETTGGFGTMYQFDENIQRHGDYFFTLLSNHIDHLNKVLRKEDSFNEFQDSLGFQKVWTDTRYNWKTRTAQWTNFLNATLREFS